MALQKHIDQAPTKIQIQHIVKWNSLENLKFDIIAAV